MIIDFIKQINWVDIFVIILLFRIIYIAIRKGLVIEVFKLAGTLTAVFFSFHFFTSLSDFLLNKINLKFLSLEFLDFLSFIILALLGYGIFLLLRETLGKLIKMEASPNFSHWGGLFLGVIRAIIFVSLVIFIMAIPSITYFKKSINDSYLGKKIFYVSPKVYEGIWNSLISKFMPEGKINSTISEIQQNFEIY